MATLEEDENGKVRVMGSDVREHGLMARYVISKANGEAVDPSAEYFVLRLDSGGSDSKHIEACRIAIREYANAIRDHLPLLARDLDALYGRTSESFDRDEPQEPTMSDLKEAEERTNRWRECCERNSHDDHEYASEPDLQEDDERELIDWALDRLASDRAEAAERAKPIDAAVCLSLGMNQFGSYSAISINGVHVWWVFATGEVGINGACLSPITTRGQLEYLIRSLKGGAA